MENMGFLLKYGPFFMSEVAKHPTIMDLVQKSIAMWAPHSVEVQGIILDVQKAAQQGEGVQTHA